MATVPQYHNMEVGKEKIALANIVGPQEGIRYAYIATRMYDVTKDTVTDEVLWFKGVPTARCNNRDFSCASWRDLPALDIKTKQLVGKNKEKYCTLLSIRTYILGRASDNASDDSKSIISFRAGYCSGGCYQTHHVLGYTFIDVNGDKVYLTVAQLRKSDILQHAHSMERAVQTGGLYRWLRNKSAQKTTCIIPLLERAEEDIVIEDSEIDELEAYKALTGSWYTISPSGTLNVDRAVLEAAQLEVIEVPTGVRCIPAETFMGISCIKRIKLPETLYEIGRSAFGKMLNLEEVNIPSQVKELNRVFDGCHNLKRLDLSGVETLRTETGIPVDYLVLPDVLLEVKWRGVSTVGVLEFRSVQGMERRVLKVQRTLIFPRFDCAVCAKKIITNGPVVLGDYGVTVRCTDASELEPNIVGIASNSSFYKVDSERNVQPWLLRSSVEFIYKQRWYSRYSLAEDVYVANKLRAVYVSSGFKIKLPKSVEILQGELGDAMYVQEYPSVVYASAGLLCSCTPDVLVDTAVKLPSLRWILPEGKTLTEIQIKRLEKKLTSMLPEICAYVQEITEQDLTTASGMSDFVFQLLQGDYDCDKLHERYGMIYVGDYSEVLKGK